IKLGSADRYLADYVVCILVYLHFMFARQAALCALEALARPIRALAAYTFTLYLVHGLVLGIWEQAHDPAAASWYDAAVLAGYIGAATYACGFLTERRKQWYQQRFAALYGFAARRLA
ncbi:MAG: hypothetical protein H7176_07330, partial [Bdellovibrionales bacterium]|nr:hypothetical protein [Massilia sp.]